jgi:soluble lytic murein transglycosylase-like protein
MPRPVTRTGSRLLIVALAIAGVLVIAGQAAAELVTLISGRTLSVKSARYDGQQVTLALRGGGELVCERRLIARLEPDEVPYPEEPAPASLSGISPAVADTPFDALIQAAADRHGLDVQLLTSVIRTESNFVPRARSRKGAMGLMQLMPQTARTYDVDDPYDAKANIEAGARHLRALLDRFELPVALAAYNAGEAAVRRFGGIPPFRETRAYVQRILTLTGHTAAVR